MNRSMWLIGTFRNSIVVIVSSYVGYVYITSTGHDVTSNAIPPIPFKVVGEYALGTSTVDHPNYHDG